MNVPLTAFLPLIVFLTLSSSGARDMDPALLPESSASGDPILELSVRAFTVYDMTCMSPLYTRIYVDGRFEVQICEKQPSEKGAGHKYAVTSRQYRLSPEDVKTLLRLAEDPGVLRAEHAYIGPGLGDGVLEILLTYRGSKGTKRVMLSGLVPFEDERRFPPALYRLLMRISELIELQNAQNRAEWTVWDRKRQPRRWVESDRIIEVQGRCSYSDFIDPCDCQ